MNIYFCGLIGSGKTTIGREVARRLRWPFFDVDQVMEKEAGKRIHDIVAEEGWVSYREKEYTISKGLSRKNHAVVAMAGGTVRYEWNMDILKGTGVTILLNARINTLVQRAIKNDRPRVNPVSDLKADLILLWKEKRHLYYGAADLLYRTDRNKTVKQEAEEIIKILKKEKILDQ
jgi:shikimate kinase